MDRFIQKIFGISERVGTCAKDLHMYTYSDNEILGDHGMKLPCLSKLR